MDDDTTTDTMNLYELFRARQHALKKIFDDAPRSALRDLTPAARDRCDADSRELRRLTRRIVAELRRRDAPVEIPGATLWLTADRLSFCATIPGTSRPLGLTDSEWSSTPRTMLYQYHNHRPGPDRREDHPR